jgi:hypothetical protein
MTQRQRPSPDIEAFALPMLGKSSEPGQPTAATLGLPYLRIVAGRPTIIRPDEET